MILRLETKYKWDLNCFNDPPPALSPNLNNISNQRAFMDELAKKLNVTHFSAWYNVSTQKLIQYGGQPLLFKYAHSLSKALSSIYPEYPTGFLLKTFSHLLIHFLHKWNIFKFARVPSKYWDSLHNQRAFMDDLASSLNIPVPEGWYHVSTTTLSKRASTLLSRYNGSRFDLLRSVYPEYREHDFMLTMIYSTGIQESSSAHLMDIGTT